MAESALFIGWNRAIPGREIQAIEFFQQSMPYWQRQVDAKVIESYEPVTLAPHGGDLNGFVLVRGDAAKLAAMRQTDEYKDMMARGLALIQGIGVIEGNLGNALRDGMARTAKAIPK